jgi:glycosyltransferase 2 family protein
MAVSALAGAVIGLTCVGFVASRMASQWSEVRNEVADASLGWIGAAVVLAAAGMTWIAACWRRALALSGPVPGRPHVIAWYYGGEIGKYVPGVVWPVLGRGELARRGGVSRTRAYPSVGLSLVTLYLAALGVASVLVPLDLAKQSESPAALALLALLPLGLAALHPRVLGWARDHAARLAGPAAGVVIPPWPATIRLVVSYVPAWLFIWGATWCTARSLLPDPPFLRIGIATTLSWTAGFVAVPVPAGAGVREAVFVAASGLPAGLGATIAIGSRLAFLLVDVTGALLTGPWHRRADRTLDPMTPRGTTARRPDPPA